MAMAPYVDIDFSQRMAALRDVGIQLGLAPNLIPDVSAANSQRTYLKVINGYRVAKSLAPLPSLDYTGFVAALNVLVALTETPSEPEIITEPVASSNATPPVIGSVLTSTNGTWSNTPTSFTYQWQRNGINITGAITAQHTVVLADTGSNFELTCLVTAINAGGPSLAAASNAVLVP
jgi:hypothetical protein